MSFIRYPATTKARHTRAFLPFPPPSTPHNSHAQRKCSFSATHSRTNHPHPARHTTAINKHAKSGNLAQLQLAIRSAARDGYELNAVNYTTIANAHAEHGNPEQVFNVLSMMRKRQIPPTNVTLRVAIKGCQKWRNLRRSQNALLETLRWICAAQIEPCLRSWNLALGVFAKQGAYTQVRDTIQWMQSADNLPNPDTRSYNIYISAYRRSNRMREAIHVFRRMLLGPLEIHPDVITYNTLLDIAVVTDFLRMPPSVAQSPLRFVKAILGSMARQNVKPNLTTETLILRVLCRKDAGPPDSQFLWTRFTNLLEDDSRPLDKQYLDAAIIGFGRAHDNDGMLNALTEMIDSSVQPDSYTFKALLLGASHLGDVGLAKSIVDVLNRNGVTVDAHQYTTAISSCARSDPLDPSSAEAFLQSALAHGVHWTPAMVNAAISSYGNDSTSAIKLWQKLRATSDEQSRDALHERMVYDALMRVCGRQARPDLALRIFYAAKKAGHVRANSANSRSLYNAFRRGSKEAGLDEDVDKNVLKSPYVQHLKTECGVFDDVNLPVERIRIKL